MFLMQSDNHNKKYIYIARVQLIDRNNWIHAMIFRTGRNWYCLMKCRDEFSEIWNSQQTTNTNFLKQGNCAHLLRCEIVHFDTKFKTNAQKCLTLIVKTRQIIDISNKKTVLLTGMAHYWNIHEHNDKMYIFTLGKKCDLKENPVPIIFKPQFLVFHIKMMFD